MLSKRTKLNNGEKYTDINIEPRFEEDENPRFEELEPSDSEQSSAEDSFENSNNLNLNPESTDDSSSKPETLPTAEALPAMFPENDARTPSINGMMQLIIQQNALLQKQMMEQQKQLNEQNSKFNKQIQIIQNRSFLKNEKKGPPPKFSGKDLENVDNWIMNIQEHYSDEKRMMAALNCEFVDKIIRQSVLTGTAMTWYHTYKYKAVRESITRTWEDFKKEIRLRFRDKDFQFKLLSKMAFDKPTDGDMSGYIARFMNSMAQSEWDEDTIKRWFFQLHLQPDITSYITRNIKEPYEITDCMDLAQTFVDAESRSIRGTVRRQPHHKSKDGAGRISQSTDKFDKSKRFTKEKTNIECRDCKQKGHYSKKNKHCSHHEK